MLSSFNRWIGKVAVVTGANAGIGAATAELLVEKGLIVAGLDRSVKRMEDNSKKLSGQPGKLVPLMVDVTNEQQLTNAFEWINNNLGPAHVLMNNAGVLNVGPLWSGNTEDWRETLDVNVLAVCIASREAIKAMKKNNINGHIININSVGGHKVVDIKDHNIYYASKFALRALTETLQKEIADLGLKIKITSLSPGIVRSEMSTWCDGYSKERLELIKSLPALDPKDVAEAVLYVLSPPEHVQINELIITPLGERYR